MISLISPFTTENSVAPSALTLYKEFKSDYLHTWGRPFPDAESTTALISSFLLYTTVKNKHVLFKLLACDIFVMAA